MTQYQLEKIPLPQLDDLSYADLVREAIERIPRILPEWTDHNPSDPGITLVELFAWLTELLIYRVNRIPEAHYRTFLKLLNDPASDYSTLPNLEDAIRLTLRDLRERYRAVTLEDYELLVLENWYADLPVVDRKRWGRIARAKAIPQRNLEAAIRSERHDHAEGHISVIVVPQQTVGAMPIPSPKLLAHLWTYLDERRLITTRHHVVAPIYVRLGIAVVVKLEADALARTAFPAIQSAIEGFLHPLRGGDDGHGYPFGRSVFASDLYRLIANLEGVRYVQSVEFMPSEGADADRIQRRDDHSPSSFKLFPEELPFVDRDQIAVSETLEGR